MSYVLPAVRELFGQHPRAEGCSPEQIATLLWALRYTRAPVTCFEVEACLEALDIERGEAA
jgi:hypothetical protein